MTTYTFEAMDATGNEIRDCIEASSEEEASTTIRQMGYFVTKISSSNNEFRGFYTKDNQKRGFSITPLNWDVKISIGWFILLGGMIAGYFMHFALTSQ